MVSQAESKEKMMTFLEKKISIKQVLAAFMIAATCIILFTAGGCTDPSQSSTNGQQTAMQKWGQPGQGVTNYYEYQQMQQIYQMRDNPNLVLNAYLYSEITGNLSCLGRVKGFGVPYGTQESPPNNGTQPVPEPNGLYPSQSTNADWVQLIDPATGKTFITFVEPNLVITQLTLPCKPLSA
jgi:hypothetical protein